MRQTMVSVSTAVLAALALGAGGLAAQQPDYQQHFQVYTGEGKPATLADIAKAMAGVDVVLVGESHADPVGHHVETELLRAALAGTRPPGGTERPVALSLEMFERDVQEIVDEYLQGLITEEQFIASSRAWDYYRTDYRPMVELAKSAGIPVIAANAPRRYVNRVSRLGRDALAQLPAHALGYLPPVPWPQPSEAYRREWTELMTNMPMTPQCPAPPAAAEAKPGAPGQAAAAGPPAGAPPAAAAPGHVRPDSQATHGQAAAMRSHMASFMENGLQAQSLWDAAMAHAIAAHLAAHPGALVLHAVGGFHVANHTGTPEQLKHYRPGTRMLVVSMEPVEDFRTFDQAEFGGQGDFVVLTDQALNLETERNCNPRRQR